MTAGAGVRLRSASLEDAAFLRRLRNDPITRAMSFRTSEVTRDEHLAWLRARLASRDATTKLWVALLGDRGSERRMGQVRLDVDPRGARAEISLAIAPRFRGRGLAVPLLCRALKHVPSSIERVLARIRVENTASLSAFRRAGFRRHAGVRKDPAPHLVLLWRRPVGKKG